jgi:O-antigen/teichoic acid export membrane protein
MYGDRFLPAVKPMMILVPGSVLYLLSRILRELLNSRGRPEMSGLAMLVSTVVNVILCWSLVPQIGTAGAALAQTSANVLLLVAFALMVRNKYKIRLNHCLILKTRDVLSVIQEFRNMRTKDVQ